MKMETKWVSYAKDDCSKIFHSNVKYMRFYVLLPISFTYSNGLTQIFLNRNCLCNISHGYINVAHDGVEKKNSRGKKKDFKVLVFANHAWKLLCMSVKVQLRKCLFCPKSIFTSFGIRTFPRFISEISWKTSKK